MLNAVGWINILSKFWMRINLSDTCVTIACSTYIHNLVMVLTDMLEEVGTNKKLIDYKHEFGTSLKHIGCVRELFQ